jgi:hypothetical protein
LTGVAGSAATGTITGRGNANLTLVAASGASVIGSVSVTAGGSASVGLVGVSATGWAGDVEADGGAIALSDYITQWRRRRRA